MGLPAVAQTRLHLANERTMLSWMKLGCIFALGGFLTSTLRIPDSDNHAPALSTTVTASTVSGYGSVSGYALMQMVLAACVVISGAQIFHIRRGLLDARWMGSYGMPRVLFVAIAGIFLMLGATFLIAMLHEVSHFSPDCLRLHRTLEDLPAPYLYISLHGASDPLSDICTGLGAVQRFSLTGAYIGPATDQISAMVHSPRGMVLHNELLILADAGEGAIMRRPSLAVFGDCAGHGIRPFLGRVLADDVDIEALFAHPYGVASSKDMQTLQVSTQNGGALLSVDLSNLTRPITLVDQLEQTKLDLGDGSGRLRGLGITDNGCSHVADKAKNLVWHLCPGRARAYTHIPTPIGITAYGNDLYVGSSHQHDPAVYVLRPRGDSDQEADESAMDGTYDVAMKIRHKYLVHPAGMLLHEGTLFVLEQTHRALFTFDAETGEFISKLIDGLPDRPEAVLLVKGC